VDVLNSFLDQFATYFTLGLASRSIVFKPLWRLGGKMPETNIAVAANWFVQETPAVENKMERRSLCAP
jgi:hypothetical protein